MLRRQVLKCNRKLQLRTLPEASPMQVRDLLGNLKFCMFAHGGEDPPGAQLNLAPK